MSVALAKGGNAPVPPGSRVVRVVVASAGGPALDISGLLVDGSGRVRNDNDFVFYNAPASLDGSVRYEPGALCVELPAVPLAVEKVVVAASADGAAFGTVPGLSVTVLDGPAELIRFEVSGATTETAFVLGELYRRGTDWKFRAVGQGWASGLAGLATDFGISVDEEAAATPPPAPLSSPGRTLDLEKRVERQAPQLLSLVKNVGVSLEKTGLDAHTARVALVLDVSVSMGELYATGVVQAVAERALALALRFDDDEAVDVFTVGGTARSVGSMDLTNATDFVVDAGLKLEPGTNWGQTMALVRQYYFGEPQGRAVTAKLPVYVLFVTDGGTTDPQLTQAQLIESSREPLFWQVLVCGDIDAQLRSVYAANFGPGGPNAAVAAMLPEEQKQLMIRRSVEASLATVRSFDAIPGRFLDNYAVVELPTAAAIADPGFYDQLLGRYPRWLHEARAHGLVLS